MHSVLHELLGIIQEVGEHCAVKMIAEQQTKDRRKLSKQ